MAFSGGAEFSRGLRVIDAHLYVQMMLLMINRAIHLRPNFNIFCQKLPIDILLLNHNRNMLGGHVILYYPMIHDYIIKT